MASELVSALRAASNHLERQWLIDSAVRSDANCLSGKTLDDLDLSELRLSGLRIQHSTFAGSICRNTQFPPLSHCNLETAVVTGASFPRLYACNFRRADAANSWLGNRIAHCDFSFASLEHARVRCTTQENWPGIEGNTFDHSNLTHLDAAGCFLSDTSLRSADLSYARLSRSVFKNSDFTRAVFSDANLLRASFENCECGGAAFERSIVDSAAECRSIPSAFRSQCRLRDMEAARRALSLCRRLVQVASYRIVWTLFNATQQRPPEHLMLWQRRPEATVEAHAFTDGGEFLRIIATAEGRYVDEVILECAADYIDWSLSAQSVEVDRDVDYDEVSRIADQIGECLVGSAI